MLDQSISPIWHAGDALPAARTARTRNPRPFYCRDLKASCLQVAESTSFVVRESGECDFHFILLCFVDVYQTESDLIIRREAQGLQSETLFESQFLRSTK